jgi:hypothetical protein
MTKAKAIGEIRQRGERDLSISDGAWRLLCRICSHMYVNPKVTLEDTFPLPWSKVALWCGLNDDKSAARRIAELVDRNYLKCDGLQGSPPINHFFLVSNCPEKGAIDCPEKGAIDCPSRGAINCPSRGALHKSNSFQEERFKERGEELGGSAATKRKGGNGSLRSKETKGDGLAASPKKLTAAEITEECARLRREIESR